LGEEGHEREEAKQDRGGAADGEVRPLALVILGVDGGNDAAVGFYSSAGFEIISTTKILDQPPGEEIVSR
jgi:ribosomal protein S18 acetylase RimI-like enzyme